MLGFVPMWFKATQAIEQRHAAQRGVRLAQFQNTLGSAVIDVQRGQYEPARQLTSDFYTNLRCQIDGDSRSLFTPSQREGAQVVTCRGWRGDSTAIDRLLYRQQTRK